MSEYKWKDIEFEEYVIDTIKLFNSVLAKLNVTGLLENSDFKVYEGFTFESVLSLTLEKTNCVSLYIMLDEGIRIDIDGIPESCEFSKQDLIEKKDETVNIIKLIFSGYLMIEYRKYSKYINFFYDDGKAWGIWSFNSLWIMLGNFYIKNRVPNQRLFLPIYPQKKK
jgi:hypothetical protein